MYPPDFCPRSRHLFYQFAKCCDQFHLPITLNLPCWSHVLSCKGSRRVWRYTSTHHTWHGDRAATWQGSKRRYLSNLPQGILRACWIFVWLEPCHADDKRTERTSLSQHQLPRKHPSHCQRLAECVLPQVKTFIVWGNRNKSTPGAVTLQSLTSSFSCCGKRTLTMLRAFVAFVYLGICLRFVESLWTSNVYP